MFWDRGSPWGLMETVERPKRIAGCQNHRVEEHAANVCVCGGRGGGEREKGAGSQVGTQVGHPAASG